MRKQVQMRINTNGRYSKYGMHSSRTCRREVHMKEKDSVIDNVKSADSRKTSDKKIISDNKTMSATGKPSAGENRENKMGVMSEGKLLMSMSLPMIISMLFQAMYNVVDSVFVSRFSMDGLTAVSTAFPIQNLMIGVFSGLGVGFNAFISKALGEKKFDRANEVARQGIFLEAIGYVIFLIIGLFFARTFMVSQTGDAQVIQYGTEYLEVCCCCAFGIAFQMTFERLLQSTGRTMYSMITQILGAVINLILDPIMIFGLLGCPRMGVRGGHRDSMWSVHSWNFGYDLQYQEESGSPYHSEEIQTTWRDNWQDTRRWRAVGYHGCNRFCDELFSESYTVFVLQVGSCCIWSLLQGSEYGVYACVRIK